MKDYPTLQQHADLFETFENMGAEKVKEHLSSLENVPSGLWHVLRFNGLESVDVTGGNITDLPGNEHNRGVRPRGWHSDDTWDVVCGVYSVSSKRVLLAGGHRGVSVGTVAMHELGHAVSNSISALSHNSAKFQAVYTKIYDRLSEYCQQAGSAGREEAFAEVFSLYYTHGKAAVDRRYGEVAGDYIETELKDVISKATTKR